jgi:restriction endonuclease S subunit
VTDLKGPISKFFDVGRGSSGITEELIYNNSGTLPVISATSSDFEIFGKVDEYLFKDKIVNNIILVVRVGKAGKCQLVEQKCVVTENVLTLKLKKEYADRISIYWFYRYVNHILITNARGDLTGQRNISKDIIDRIKVIIPEKPIQEKTDNLYHLVEKKTHSLNQSQVDSKRQILQQQH